MKNFIPTHPIGVRTKCHVIILHSSAHWVGLISLGLQVYLVILEKVGSGNLGEFASVNSTCFYLTVLSSQSRKYHSHMLQSLCFRDGHSNISHLQFLQGLLDILHGNVISIPPHNPWILVNSWLTYNQQSGQLLGTTHRRSLVFALSARIFAWRSFAML